MFSACFKSSIYRVDIEVTKESKWSDESDEQKKKTRKQYVGLDNSKCGIYMQFPQFSYQDQYKEYYSDKIDPSR